MLLYPVPCIEPEITSEATIMSNTTKLSRRQFALAAAAAAGATWFDAPRVLSAQPRSRERFGGFPMGIQSYTLREFDVDGAIDRIAELGLHNVEFFGGHYPPTEDREMIARMDRRLAERDIVLRAHGVNGFGADHEANERLFWFARMAGIRTITANPSPESFESLEDLVARFNFRIAIHNHGPGARYDSVEDSLNAAEGRDRRIGFCADLGHYIRSGVDPIEATRRLGNRLYGVHLKDFARAGRDAPETVIGDGVLDVEGFFRVLKEVRFPADGALSLEYELDPEDPMEGIRLGLRRASEAATRVAAA
jgi:inosose dehydratase